MMKCVSLAVVLCAGGVNGFVVAPLSTNQHSSSIMFFSSSSAPMAGGSSESVPGEQNTPDQNGSSAAERDDDGDNTDSGATLKGNRFSKYAPDASLNTADFRQQLKDNMKADLERRRREDPNRGNQPAKTYLDNL
ncbi:hypothetical protein ACHAXM_002089 [Skeletonema potamos]|jgi:hypothetical protein